MAGTGFERLEKLVYNRGMVQSRETIFDKTIPHHILTRAVEGRRIFAREEDCLRFVFQMYAANMGRSVPNLHRQDIIKISQSLLDNETIEKQSVIVEHQPLVNFLSFALVGNHYHFLLVPNSDNGIAKFMQKLNVGYAKYFNLKYNRRGNLFEKPYKSIPIKNDSQLDAIICYINVINPLDVYQPGWREKGLSNREEAFDFLERYKFSSILDLFGERRSKIIAPQQVLERFLPEGIAQNYEQYLDFVKDYLENKTPSFNHLFLEY